MKSISEVQVELIKRGWDKEAILSEEVESLIESYLEEISKADRVVKKGIKAAKRALKKNTSSSREKEAELVHNLSVARAPIAGSNLMRKEKGLSPKLLKKWKNLSHEEKLRKMRNV